MGVFGVQENDGKFVVGDMLVDFLVVSREKFVGLVWSTLEEEEEKWDLYIERETGVGGCNKVVICGAEDETDTREMHGLGLET